MGQPTRDGFSTRPARREPNLEQILQAAGSVGRSSGPEGVEALLNLREAKRVAQLFESLSAGPRQELSSVLSGLGGPGAAVARGLFLRAVSARALALPDDPKAMATLRSFAERLKGMSPEQMLTHATVLDLDSRRNDSGFDPQVLWDRTGVIHPRQGDTGAADNDGLSQRFTASCGPTVMQMMLAEADPVVAFALNDEGLNSDETRGEVASFQKEILTSLGGVAAGRVELQLRSRLKNALGRLRQGGKLSQEGSDALLRHALDRGPLNAQAKAALQTLRTSFRGFPSAEELSRVRRAPLPRVDAGIDAQAMLGAMARILGPVTGTTYRPTSPLEGFARGQAWRHLDEAARALRRGEDVPFGIAEPAHWMLLTAVKGRKPDREFLVSDPDGGRTAWVTEKDFLRGTFAEQQFYLNTPQERPYVDSFLLPG